MVVLVALSLVKNEEYWIWYSLTSVHAHVDRILFFDNHSEDRTLEVVRGMEHIADKLEIHERFGGSSEAENREACLSRARDVGATHVLFVDGDEVHADRDLSFARRILEVTEHSPPLGDPAVNDGRPGDHRTTDGALVKNIGFKPVHPGFAGPATCIDADLTQPDTDHGCYNFAIRICALANLRGNAKEWGQHGYLETGGLYVQSSPSTLWCPGLFYFHFTHHPRSPARVPGKGPWVRPVADLGSNPLRETVEIPDVLFRPDGPAIPTLEQWGMAPAGS